MREVSETVRAEKGEGENCERCAVDAHRSAGRWVPASRVRRALLRYQVQDFKW